MTSWRNEVSRQGQASRCRAFSRRAERLVEGSGEADAASAGLASSICLQQCQPYMVRRTRICRPATMLTKALACLILTVFMMEASALQISHRYSQSVAPARQSKRAIAPSCIACSSFGDRARCTYRAVGVRMRYSSSSNDVCKDVQSAPKAKLRGSGSKAEQTNASAVRLPESADPQASAQRDLSDGTLEQSTDKRVPAATGAPSAAVKEDGRDASTNVVTPAGEESLVDSFLDTAAETARTIAIASQDVVSSTLAMVESVLSTEAKADAAMNATADAAMNATADEAANAAANTTDGAAASATAGTASNETDDALVPYASAETGSDDAVAEGVRLNATERGDNGDAATSRVAATPSEDDAAATKAKATAVKAEAAAAKADAAADEADVAAGEAEAATKGDDVVSAAAEQARPEAADTEAASNGTELAGAHDDVGFVTTGEASVRDEHDAKVEADVADAINDDEDDAVDAESVAEDGAVEKTMHLLVELDEVQALEEAEVQAPDEGRLQVSGEGEGELHALDEGDAQALDDDDSQVVSDGQAGASGEGWESFALETNAAHADELKVVARAWAPAGEAEYERIEHVAVIGADEDGMEIEEVLCSVVDDRCIALSVPIRWPNKCRTAEEMRAAFAELSNKAATLSVDQLPKRYEEQQQMLQGLMNVLNRDFKKLLRCESSLVPAPVSDCSFS
uniref:Uncharacterized protein n=1 Tax=Chrysotila carterae TaxID=13221 RepID=A0A7S4BDJ0_CHRCT